MKDAARSRIINKIERLPKKQGNFTKIKPRINVQKDKNEMFDELMMQGEWRKRNH